MDLELQPGHAADVQALDAHGGELAEDRLDASPLVL